MKDIYRDRLGKEQIFTLPNVLSFARILLIPLILFLYLGLERHHIAAGVVVLSALTDILDGWIARHFHMISDLGKFLDPLADKLTQGAMLVCLVFRYPYMGFLIAVLLAKELFQFICGLRLLKKANRVDSSRWFGKVCTAVFYVGMLTLFLLPDEGVPETVTVAIMLLCLSFMILSFIGYARFYSRMNASLQQAQQEEDHAPGTPPEK